MEAAFDYQNRKAALVLLTRYQTAAGIRRAGAARIANWLQKQGCRLPEAIAESALTAPGTQLTAVPGVKTAALLVAKLAADILRLYHEVEEVEALIGVRLPRT